ncbi:nuclear transport factor 2 family protein [Micromonospora tulbaghiae]|uniref:nuclear transport factor 2 family protein n=1 Tax=Micromonospora tulbaghiae TaxID=479978 RepID=UPI00340C28C3
MTEVQNFGRQLGDFLGGVFADAAGGGAGVFRPDPQAEIEVRQLLNDLQTAFAEKNADAIVDSLAEEFTTYELTSAEGHAVTITEKAAMREYLDTLFPADGETQNKSVSVSQVLASSTIGLTREDGDVVIARTDGTFEHQPLRASAVAIRTAEGWKWLHWHMSAAAPRFRVNANGVRIPLDGAPATGIPVAD